MKQVRFLSPSYYLYLTFKLFTDTAILFPLSARFRPLSTVHAFDYDSVLHSDAAVVSFMYTCSRPFVKLHVDRNNNSCTKRFASVTDEPAVRPIPIPMRGKNPTTFCLFASRRVNG